MQCGNVNLSAYVILQNKNSYEKNSPKIVACNSKFLCIYRESITIGKLSFSNKPIILNIK